jgi:uncharacterized delta-60 repeat protein
VLAGVDMTARPTATPNAIAVGPDGRIVVGGGTSGSSILAAFAPDGTVDPAFATAQPSFNRMIRDLAFLPDGRFLVAGSHFGFILVARYLPTGALDTTFGGVAAGSDLGGDGWVGYKDPNSSGANAFAATVRLLPDGKVFVGAFNGYPNDHRFVMYRLAGNGARDATFGLDGNGRVDWNVPVPQLEPGEYAVQPDGKILAVGSGSASSSSSPRPIVLARFNPNGTYDQSFGAFGTVYATPGLNNRGYSVALDRTGRVLVSGSIDNKFTLLRFTPDGAPDTEFGTAGRVVDASFNPNTSHVVVQPDGRILVGAGAVARFLPSPLTVAVAQPAAAGAAGVAPAQASPTPGAQVAPAPVSSSKATTPVAKTDDDNKKEQPPAKAVFSTARVAPSLKPKPLAKPAQRSRR